MIALNFTPDPCCWVLERFRDLDLSLSDFSLNFRFPITSCAYGRSKMFNEFAWIVGLQLSIYALLIDACEKLVTFVLLHKCEIDVLYT